MRKPDSADLAAALDAMAQPVVIVDARAAICGVIYANAAFARMTGYGEELLGRSLLTLAGGETDVVVQQQLREAIHAGKDFSAEWIIHRRDGAAVWTRVSSRAVDTAAGSVHAAVTFEDICDYKLACESLRSSEARLDLAMSASELSMWDWNVAHDEVSYNDQWRSSIGIDPQQLLARENLSDRLMLPADDPPVLEKFEQYFNGSAPRFECEYRLPTRDGAPKWFLARARVVRRDGAGKPLRVIGVLRDISPTKQRQHEALEVEQRWERAIRGTSDGLYDWNLATGHVWYAARFRAIVGYAAHDFPDTFQAFQGVLHADDRTLVLGKIRAHLENQNRLDIRCRIVRRNGEVVWCRLRGEAERDAAGRPARIAGSLTDISGQIDAEEALSRSQDFYGTILDSLPLFIAYCDADERIVYANRMFQRFFDVPLASSRGRTINDVIGDKRYGVIGPHVREALRGRAIEGQGRFRDTSGRSFDLEAAFIPHPDDAGEIQGCFVAARDVTEKRLLEAELRQSQKMEAVGRLTGGIAHDFNNLLSVIIGNMQLLARSLRESPRLLHQTDTALSAAMRGAELTRRLLAFARQQVLEPKILDVNGLIDGMYELLRRTLTDDIEIRQELESQLWAAKVDPGQLENAVLNLVINARDAMPSGGVITITTRNVVISAQRSGASDATRPSLSLNSPHSSESATEEPLTAGEYAVLEVTDTGMGMSNETLKRAFEPFFTTKDVGKGSGLGLSMVYGFVKQSEGHVRIASAPGQGTTVHLYFPRTRAPAERVSLDAGGHVDLPRGHETILVVEDNTEVRATAVEILGGLGYQLLEAANGHQALEQFMQHPEIELVFSDIMLPGGLLGPQLVRKLSERRPELKVLMTSGFSESGMLQRGMIDGTIELLPKPYRVEDLARRVRAKLDGKEENQRVPA
jgi:PAS domain S-box-containing protein